MAIFSFKSFVLAFVALATTVDGIDITYRAEPTTVWEAQVQSVQQGNGAFLSPDESILTTTTNLGYVNAFDAKTGTELWKFVPPANNNEFLACTSGITFVTPDGMHENTTIEDYLVYSIIVNELSSNPQTRVIALSMDGDKLWSSEGLDGVTPGTPVASKNGHYVFLTHNSNGGKSGHFTILDGLTGDVFFSTMNENAPFAPLGIYHEPAEGYYDGGEFNRNDILVWSVQPKPDVESVGDGAIFAFQFPIGFNGQADGLAYTQLGTDVRDFQAIQKPVLTNEGLSLYWGNTRSQFRCWVGEQGLDRFKFDRPKTGNVGFSRGDPAGQAVFAPLALSHNETNLFLYGGTAAKEFVRLNEDFSEQLLIGTLALVKTEARVSPDDKYVYYVEFNGRLHQASTDDLMDSWLIELGIPVEGEFALRKDGTILYIVDYTGQIQALRVADVPTEEPSASPSETPTIKSTQYPTEVPTQNPTRRPTQSQTKPPVVPPTSSTKQPTPSGVPPPTDKPINVGGINDLKKSAGCLANPGIIISGLALVPILLL